MTAAANGGDSSDMCMAMSCHIAGTAPVLDACGYLELQPFKAARL